MPKISIIIPCYFNELNIPVTKKVLIENEAKFPSDVTFEYVLVDDGSKDKTYEELLKFHAEYPHKIKLVKLARNFGANNASLAGIRHATGDCCVILAADLQDPPEVIARMYDYWTKGFKLVVASKSSREDTFMTKLVSNTYHNLIRATALKNAPKGGFDLWLFDAQLREDINKINEKNTFLPYLFMWLGYEYVNIPYTRKKRELGKSQWTLSKKIKSFIDSFVAFSFWPIRFISSMGLFMGFAAIIYAFYLVIASLRGNIEVEGWSTIIVLLLVIGSFLMFSVGILGEYLWRTLDEARNRPNFVVDEVVSGKNTSTVTKKSMAQSSKPEKIENPIS